MFFAQSLPVLRNPEYCPNTLLFCAVEQASPQILLRHSIDLPRRNTHEEKEDTKHCVDPLLYKTNFRVSKMLET